MYTLNMKGKVSFMISHHHKCIFVHIPKNAGQSVEHVFLNLLGLNWETRAPLLLRYNDKPELGPPRLAHLKANEYVRYNYLTQEMFDDYFKFAFVRNPWSRTVSMYKYLGYSKKWISNHSYSNI
ncbi:sulfotransferase family 2 domain-containing protein [Vibrio hannami]|uniref:sulfotransferase family 2 domain-containing protein n=1 Tax=Vibrio hannami TaxID=2717094 RepID=UPI003BB0BEE7